MSTPPKDPIQRKRRLAVWPLLFVLLLIFVLWLRRPEAGSTTGQATPGDTGQTEISQPTAPSSE